MKLPGRFGRGPKADDDSGAEADGDETTESAESESAARARRERLARARRERAAMVRADLATKAQGDDAETKGRGEDEETKGRSGDAGTKGRRPRGRREPELKRPSGLRAADEGRNGAALVRALRQGAGETRKRAVGAAPHVAKRSLAILGAFYTVFFAVLGFVLGLGIALVRFLAGPGRSALRRGRRFLEHVSRALTPARVLALVAAGAIVLLMLSQFADYRTISIGNDNYADGIQTVAPAPERDREEAGSAHGYALVPVGALCLVLLAFSLSGRWRLCRLIALGGIAAIVIGLLVDRPAGLDPGETATNYQGVRAMLLGGFYAQLFAGLLVTVSSLLLGRELRLTGAERPERATRGSDVRRRLLRRNPDVEGARA